MRTEGRAHGEDACPGVLRLHEAADGFLARVRLPGGRLRVDGMLALADAADDFGDGHLDITSRANIQIRGLERGAADELGPRLEGAGLLPSASHERVRNIISSPLSGRDGRGHLDVRDAVDELDRALCDSPDLARLPGRFLFVLDDGREDVRSLQPDVGVLGLADGRAALLIAGRDSGRRIDASVMVTAMLEAAKAFLEARDRDPSIRRAEGQTDRPQNERRPEPMGVIPQSDGRVALGFTSPFGRLSSEQARQIAEIMPTNEIRVTPWRGIVVPDLSKPFDLGPLERAGFILDPDSPWLGVTACAGLGRCNRSLADVRRDAAASVAAGGGGRVHWVGCEKRCGLPRTAVIELLATGVAYELTSGETTTTVPTPEAPLAAAVARSNP